VALMLMAEPSEAPTVAAMIRERLIEGQALTNREPDIGDRVEQTTLSVR